MGQRHSPGATPGEGGGARHAACATHWLALIEDEKDENTVRNYKERLEVHVLPALGHLKVRELHRGHIKAFLAQKRSQGYAKNTVRLMRAPLSSNLSRTWTS